MTLLAAILAAKEQGIGATCVCTAYLRGRYNGGDKNSTDVTMCAIIAQFIRDLPRLRRTK